MRAPQKCRLKGGGTARDQRHIRSGKREIGVSE